MKLSKINFNKIFLFVFLFAIISIVILYVNTRYNYNLENEVKKRKTLILESCSIFDLHPRKYISVIYGELKNNLDQLDKIDDVRARLGFDPSIGFAQIRVSTFAWIEDNYADGFYIIKSKDRDEMIQKLISDSTNILYSIYYVKLILDKFFIKYKFEPSVKTLASYYGYGIDYYRTEIDSSYYNQIGITAEKFYNSNKLIKEFPK